MQPERHAYRMNDFEDGYTSKEKTKKKKPSHEESKKDRDLRIKHARQSKETRRYSC